MAKRKTKKTNQAKHYPVQRMIREKVIGSTTGALMVNIDRSLCAVNHRLYRQSRVYNAKIALADVANASAYEVYRLRDTWSLQKAYQMAKDEYDENVAEARKRGDEGRWNDFRINPRTHAFDLQLQPSVLSNHGGSGTVRTTCTIDEYNYSIVRKPDGNSMDFGLVADANTFSILDEYDDTKNTQIDPSNDAIAIGYEELKADRVDESMADIQNTGDLPPYDRTNLVTNDTHGNPALLEKVDTLFVDGERHKLATGFVDWPLGVIIIRPITYGPSNPNDPGVEFDLTVQSGDYKGVKARQYIDV